MSRTWKTLIIILTVVTSVKTWQQLYETQQFVREGPRFTAQDGQALCERVAVLERHSIGFQQSGSISPPCRFMRKP